MTQARTTPCPDALAPASRCLRLGAFLLPALALLGCSDGPGGAPTIEEARSAKLRASSPAVTEVDRQGLAEGNARFALALAAGLRGETGNQVVSPVSLSMAMAMTSAGARGATATEIAQALQFTLPQERLHPAMNHLDAELSARGQGAAGANGQAFRLRIVNKVWAQRGYTIEPAFLDVLAENYGAGVGLLDFAGATEPARLDINRWVSAATNERIQGLLPAGTLTSQTRLVLTNAVYLSAAWKHPFAAGQTGERDFRRLEGEPVKVMMMRLEADLSAAQGQGWAAVRLPYQDERLSMLVVVPEPGTYRAFEAALDHAKLAEITAALRPASAVVSLPRFQVEAVFSLGQQLSALGMPDAFVSGKADFSGINGGREELFIQDVVHKAFIAVGERGTQAVAATAVPIAGRSAPVADVLLYVDRPFLFFLRDEPTGAILFLGRVLDPAAR